MFCDIVTSVQCDIFHKVHLCTFLPFCLYEAYRSDQSIYLYVQLTCSSVWISIVGVFDGGLGLAYDIWPATAHALYVVINLCLNQFYDNPLVTVEFLWFVSAFMSSGLYAPWLLGPLSVGNQYFIESWPSSNSLRSSRDCNESVIFLQRSCYYVFELFNLQHCQPSTFCT